MTPSRQVWLPFPLSIQVVVTFIFNRSYPGSICFFVLGKKFDFMSAHYRFPCVRNVFRGGILQIHKISIDLLIEYDDHALNES